MARTVELYWDPASTNSYFAFHLLKPVLNRTGAELVLRPFNLGHVFRQNHYVLMDEPEAKLINRKRDLQRWAEKYDLPFRFPDVFPIKTSRILRGAFVMREAGLEREYTEAVLSAFWERNDHSIADYEGLGPIVRGLAMDPEVFRQRAESEAVRLQLIDSTNGGIDRGVFGVPSLFVGDDLFWGKDRMEFVEDELEKIPIDAGAGLG